MEALKFKTVVKQNGEIKLSGLPCRKGQKVEMIILIDSGKKGVKKVKEEFNPDNYIGILNMDKEKVDAELKAMRNEWDRF